MPSVFSSPWKTNNTPVPMPRSMRFLALLLLLFCACKKGTINRYQVAKASRSAAAASKPTLPEQEGSIGWVLPSGWTAHPPSGMRLATISIPASGKVPAAECSVAQLGGSLASNVNRWRQQAGLPALAPEDIPSSLKPIHTRLGAGFMIHLKHPSDSAVAILGAIVPLSGEKSLFLKITSDTRVTGSILADFERFAKSFHKIRK